MIARDNIRCPLWQIGLSIGMFGLGVFYHFTSDMQKYVQLKLKKGLITDGLFAKTRNPNYFGELLIYLSFTSLSRHWLPLGTLAGMIGLIWLPNMYAKDKSISRHPGWDTYKANSAFFIPYIW
eukprot:TRINITY_DN3883_c0_g1_i2.p1 TRINITY_DN3883_c0_g1~~TRINITY_DN3883_c0_g1_i2.p1  ORF type:complete len:123 (-),score=28.83 TRINITY_DN3883_c0_g1_i2:331-699(-)